jgi:hypothetical protein
LKTTDAATDFWYGGSAFYDFIKHEPKDKDNELSKRRANQFTMLVWKNSKKVGFGISKDGRYVVAWFCDEPGNQADLYPANVGQNCINSNGVNTCFNALNLAKNNEIREWHGKGKALENDVTDDTAKALQELVDYHLA